MDCLAIPLMILGLSNLAIGLFVIEQKPPSKVLMAVGYIATLSSIGLIVAAIYGMIAIRSYQ